MHTAVTEMLGIDVPVLAFSHCRDVVAEVSKAGGLGVLGAVAHTPEALEIDLKWIEEQVGDRPYGVDLIIPAKYAGDDQGGFTLDDIRQLIPAEHRAFVDDILARYEVPEPPPDDEGPGRAGWQTSGGDAPFSANRAGPQLEIALAHRTALVANALGPPPPEMIDQVKGAGRVVAALAGRGVHAERHVAAGVDLIVAQGSEAGGHTGEIGSMVLIPEVVDAVAPVPVLGAGGIGRGRQMAAAMALGAQGAWTGSIWLTVAESDTRPWVVENLLAASWTDTVRSRAMTGKPARQLRTAWTEAWESSEGPGPLPMPLQGIIYAEAAHRFTRAQNKALSGSPVGQIVGNMNAVRSTREVVFDIVEEWIAVTEAQAARLADT